MIKLGMDQTLSFAKLEGLRQEWEKLKYQMGSNYDHLDRGSPDPETREKLYKDNAYLEARIIELNRKMKTEIARLQSDHAEILSYWKLRHIEHLQSLKQEEHKKQTPDRTRIFVINELMMRWQNLFEKSQEIPIINNYYLRDYYDSF
ncbi:MAG: hypothetical protein ACLFR1_07360 [Spirochaetia bacterium]